MPAIPGSGPQELIRQDAFLRALARRLVDEPTAADDVAQDAWVAALATRSGPAGSVRAWLATVVRRVAARRRRSDRRRIAREQTVARDESVPSIAALVEREQARAMVVAAVFALPQAYRDVIVLRWFEGLPPRDVARRLGLPVETVRTRHRRALEQLRAALDGEHGGDRGAWVMALLPLTGHGAPTPLPTLPQAAATTLFGGALLMSAKMQLALAAAAAIAITCWFLCDPTGRPGRPEVRAEHPPLALAHAVPPPGDVDAEAGRPPAREPVASPVADPDAANTGRVVVHVVWTDGTTATGVQVLLQGDDRQRESATDADGLASFADLPPARYRARIARGSYRSVAEQRCVVAAGTASEIQLTVPDGLDVAGFVVDGNDRPIAEAEVVAAVMGVADPVVVARTGADGRFAARDLGIDCFVSARAPGRSPSVQRSMTGSVGGRAELRFVLDRVAATLCGRVTGPAGKPVPGALVQLCHDRRPVMLPGGGFGIPACYPPAYTDADGRFACSTIAQNALVLEVFAAGLAAWSRALEPGEGEHLEVVVQLTAGVTVRGIVRDGNGQAVADVQVRASSGDAHREGRSRPDGAYEITGVPAGTLRLCVVDTDDREGVRSVEAAPGEVVLWDPIVARTTELCGRVVDHDGRAMTSVSVAAYHFAYGAGYWHAHAATDEHGRFRLPRCEVDVPVHLSVRFSGSPFDEIWLAGVKPGGEEVTVRLPARSAVHIRGSVLDDHGMPLPNVEVTVQGENHGAHREPNRADGTFDFGPLPVGEYRLLLSGIGFARLRVPPRFVADGETWDLGELSMQRGSSLRAHFVGSGAPAQCIVDVFDADGNDAWGGASKDGTVELGPFRAGDYRVQIRGTDVACQIVPFTLRDGIDTAIDVPVQRGVATTLRFGAGDGIALPLEAWVTITEADTGTRRLHTHVVRDGELTLRTALPKGRFRVEATGMNKMQCTLSFTGELEVGDTAFERELTLR